MISSMTIPQHSTLEKEPQAGHWEKCVDTKVKGHGYSLYGRIAKPIQL